MILNRENSKANCYTIVALILLIYFLAWSVCNQLVEGFSCENMHRFCDNKEILTRLDRYDDILTKVGAGCFAVAGLFTKLILDATIKGSPIDQKPELIFLVATSVMTLVAVEYADNARVRLAYLGFLIMNDDNAVSAVFISLRGNTIGGIYAAMSCAFWLSVIAVPVWGHLLRLPWQLYILTTITVALIQMQIVAAPTARIFAYLSSQKPSSELIRSTTHLIPLCCLIAICAESFREMTFPPNQQKTSDMATSENSV
ncbi:MAG: hypothetical protein AB7N71_01010 [Phycisphaerae bacterium]